MQLDNGFDYVAGDFIWTNSHSHTFPLNIRSDNSNEKKEELEK